MNKHSLYTKEPFSNEQWKNKCEEEKGYVKRHIFGTNIKKFFTTYIIVAIMFIVFLFFMVEGLIEPYFDLYILGKAVLIITIPVFYVRTKFTKAPDNTLRKISKKNDGGYEKYLKWYEQEQIRISTQIGKEQIVLDRIKKRADGEKVLPESSSMVDTVVDIAGFLAKIIDFGIELSDEEQMELECLEDEDPSEFSRIKSLNEYAFQEYIDLKRREKEISKSSTTTISNQSEQSR